MEPVNTAAAGTPQLREHACYRGDVEGVSPREECRTHPDGAQALFAKLPQAYRHLTVQPSVEPAAANRSFAAPTSPFSSPVPDVVAAITQGGFQFAVPEHPIEHQASAGATENGNNQHQCNSSAQGGEGGASMQQASTKCSITATASCLLNLVTVGAGGAAGVAAPPHGVKAVCGKRAKMEDAFSVQTNFADVPMSPADAGFQNKLPARIALQIGEQLEQNTTTSPPVSMPLSPNSPLSTCVPSLTSSDTEASVGGSSSSSSSSSSAASSNASTCACDTLHFFGVYDGHGGVEAAQHCANRLHYHLSVALAQAVGSGTMHTHDAFCVATGNGSGSGSVQCQAEWNFCAHDEPTEVPAECDNQGPPAADDTNIPCACRSNREHTPCSSCQQVDIGAYDYAEASASEAVSPTSDDAAAAAQDGSQQVGVDEQQDSDSASNGETVRSEGSASVQCMTAALECALRDAFIRTDEEFAEDGSSAMVGSTAVVALVGTKKMWIANCGDSRAVLCRGGKAIQVTDDHKPEREDEAERVEKAGGQVLYWNGHRVMGVLAMSRAIGDHGLRPYVIPEPEITVLARVVEDDFLLLASDGLWDVMTNQEAITLAMRCLQRSWDKGTSRKAAVRVAATVLTRAAVDRGSKDNVTVVIIDLKAPQPTSSDGKQDGCDASCSQQNGTGCSAATPCDSIATATAAAAQEACCCGTEPDSKGSREGPLGDRWAGLSAAAAAAVAAACEQNTGEPHALVQQDTIQSGCPEGEDAASAYMIARQETIVRRPPPGMLLCEQDTLSRQEAMVVMQDGQSTLLEQQDTLVQRDPLMLLPPCGGLRTPSSSFLLQQPQQGCGNVPGFQADRSDSITELAVQVSLSCCLPDMASSSPEQPHASSTSQVDTVENLHTLVAQFGRL